MRLVLLLLNVLFVILMDSWLSFMIMIGYLSSVGMMNISIWGRNSTYFTIAASGAYSGSKVAEVATSWLREYQFIVPPPSSTALPDTDRWVSMHVAWSKSAYVSISTLQPCQSSQS